MTRGQKTTLALVMLFAAAAYARNKLQKIETHNGASPGVVTIKGNDFQVATGGTNGDCLVWDDTADAGVIWDSCGGVGGGIGGSVGVYEVAYGVDGGTLDSEAAFGYNPTTDSLTVDTTTFVVDGTNNRVGVLDATPDHTFDIEAGSMASTIRALNITGTLSGNAARQVGGAMTFNSTAGATGVRGLEVWLGAGYTGTESIGLLFDNPIAGTGTVPLNTGSSTGNFGSFGSSYGNTTGHNVGHLGAASYGARNYGVAGVSLGTKASAHNVGVAGYAQNTDVAGYEIGSWFGFLPTLGGTTTDPDLGGESAALIATNSTRTSAIFILRDDTADVLRVRDNTTLEVAHGIDAIGAVDMDYGSADVTDHTFTTDGTGSGEIVLPDEAIGPPELQTVAAAGASEDEYCLTYEHGTAEFEWQTCGSGGGDNVSVDSGATVDPDFQDGDVDFTYAAGVVTATVACTGCIDATDMGTDSVAADEIAAGAVGPSELAADSLTPADLDTVAAAGAPEDEYCLTYEHGTTEFQWQVCSSGGGDSITVNSGATVDPNFLNGDIDWTYAGTDITATVGCSQCVSYSEIQNVSVTDRLLGRDTAGAGVVEEITTSAALDMITTSGGAVLYRGAGWIASVWSTNAGGDIFPGSDDASELGSAALRWNELYVTHIDNAGGSMTVDANLDPDADLGQTLGNAFARWSGVYTSYLTNDAATGVIVTEGALVPDVNNTDDLGSSTKIYNEVFSSTTYINNLDGVGAVDMDYGSADITDHTFVTDGAGNAEVVLPAQSIGYAEIDIVGGTPGAGSDELCLTYEHGTLNFELQACSSGGGDSITVNSGATVDPNFLNGDIDWAYAGTNITATVACSGCVDATDMGTDSVAADEIAAGAVGASELAADSLTPADLNAVSAAGAGQDEYCLTYEHGTTEFEWQACGGGSSTWTYDRTTADVANSTTTPATTGISFALSASTTYYIRCNILGNSAATATGLQLTTTYTAAMTSGIGARSYCSSATARSNLGDTAFPHDFNALVYSNTGCSEDLQFKLVTNTAGTWELFVDSEVPASAVTVYAGSHCELSTP